MIIQCPYCHRKYEPLPNEKYCPFCGEEINRPLNELKCQEYNNTYVAPTPQKNPIRGNISKVIFIIANILMFLSFIFMFGQAFTGSSNSIFQYTFLSKDAKNSSYVGLIIAFVFFCCSYLINIRAIICFVRNEDTKSPIFIGAINIFLIIFYLMYLTFRFQTSSSSYSGTSYTTTYSLGEGAIKFISCLGISGIFYLISAGLENN